MEALESYGWRKGPSVEEGLYAEGHRFDFFQAVRLLETLLAERRPPGEGVEPELEVVRFHSRIDLGFAPSDVETIERPAREDEPAHMAINFLGLAGPHGPLPRAVTELILERVSKVGVHKDTALRDFLDIFNHRLVSLLYRARKKYRVALHWRSPEESPPIRPCFSLIGLGTGNLAGRLGVRDRALLLYTGLLSRGAPSMVGLERMLEDHFACGAAIEPYDGRWYRLSEDQWTRIGRSSGSIAPARGSRRKGAKARPQNQVLGESAVLGTRVWDQAAGFELRVGPFSFERFVDFLPLPEPEGQGYRALEALTTFYVGQDLLFRVRLLLEGAEVPPLVLGGERPVHLGWTSWLRTRGLDEAEPAAELAHDDQVVLDPDSLAGR